MTPDQLTRANQDIQELKEFLSKVENNFEQNIYEINSRLKKYLNQDILIIQSQIYKDNLSKKENTI